MPPVAHTHDIMSIIGNLLTLKIKHNALSVFAQLLTVMYVMEF